MPGKKMSNMGKDSQHYHKEVHKGELGWQGVGLPDSTKLCEKHSACSFARSSAWRLKKPSQKMFENHYTITYTDNLVVSLQSDEEYHSTISIVTINRTE